MDQAPGFVPGGEVMPLGQLSDVSTTTGSPQSIEACGSGGHSRQWPGKLFSAGSCEECCFEARGEPAGVLGTMFGASAAYPEGW